MLLLSTRLFYVPVKTKNKLHAIKMLGLDYNFGHLLPRTKTPREYIGSVCNEAQRYFLNSIGLLFFLNQKIIQFIKISAMDCTLPSKFTNLSAMEVKGIVSDLFLKGNGIASTYLMAASKLPDAPSYLFALATRLSVYQNQLGPAIIFLKEILETILPMEKQL